MYLLLIIIHLSLINCLNITNTSVKIKSTLKNKCINSRQSRCLNTYMGDFYGKTLTFFDRTQRYGEFLRSRNISECPDSDQGASYQNEHVINGLIIDDNVPVIHWDVYKQVHKKEYATSHHEMAALRKWLDNLRRVAEHNKQFLAGKQSYSLHLNHLGDMSMLEYIRDILKLITTVPLFDPAEDHRKSAFRRNLMKSVPKHVDWRVDGFRPRRERQHRCGACYAFAVSHALQAQVFIHHGDWGELSPQQIVDCSIRDGNLGCNGGSLRAALRYVARVGLVMEKYYPYVGKRGHCKTSRYATRVRPRRWATLPAGDEDAMEKALATIGPLAVGVNAAPFTFQLYRSGIYDDPFCTPWQLNHAMLLVGYSPEYWVLLNWWGKDWGEDGYIRIRRGFNICGVANMATYVEL